MKNWGGRRRDCHPLARRLAFQADSALHCPQRRTSGTESRAAPAFITVAELSHPIVIMSEALAQNFRASLLARPRVRSRRICSSNKPAQWSQTGFPTLRPTSHRSLSSFQKTWVLMQFRNEHPFRFRTGNGLVTGPCTRKGPITFGEICCGLARRRNLLRAGRFQNVLRALRPTAVVAMD